MTERVEQENKRVYIETYGCQMNVADSEIIAAQMQLAGYQLTDRIMAWIWWLGLTLTPICRT